jgi:hypothetical protein
MTTVQGRHGLALSVFRRAQLERSKYLDDAGSGALRFTRSHSIAATFLLDPYYVTHPITNDAAIQPHRSEYLRSLPTLKGLNRNLPPPSKFTPCQQRVFLGFVIFIHCFLPVKTRKQGHDRQ